MNAMKRLLITQAVLAVSSVVQARQSVVDMNFAGNEGERIMKEATLTLPETQVGKKRPAIVILHHGGGWGAGTTTQYASFLASHGFVTLEPRMFNSAGDSGDTYRHMPTVFGSLTYLAKRPEVDDKRIALMGLSYGAVLSLYAGTTWARTKYPTGDLRYAAIASFYPPCWIGKAYISRTMTIGVWKNRAYPESLMDQWGAIPLGIFAGGADDYNSKDPQACTDFVASIPDEKQRSLTQVYLYPAATHGWDHGRTYTRFSRSACKGTGCDNTNESNPEITQKGKSDLLKFLQSKLGL